MRPVVLLDCDGPLSQFTQSYLDAVRIETGVKIPVDAVDRWDIHKTAAFVEAATTAGLSPGDLKSRVIQRVCTVGFCDAIKPQPDAQAIVAMLEAQADVYVVTSPWDSSPTWMFERLHWVHRHLGLPRSRVIQTGTKHLIRGDVFVDDKATHVREWGKAWPNAKAILFDMHHNKVDADDLKRGGWRDVIASLPTGSVDGKP